MLVLSEKRQSGKDDRTMHNRVNSYRLISSGGEENRHGVWFLLDNRLTSNVENVTQVSERIIGIYLKRELRVSIIHIHALQQGRHVAEKELFYQLLHKAIDGVKYQQIIILCGDWNEHIGTDRTNYEHISIGVQGIG